ncbi:MAG: hypothetical protein SPI58_05945 [Candidatus Enteromonas sp.]|nr:hypothetical protein [Candidatus Enteromonas sp.]
MNRIDFEFSTPDLTRNPRKRRKKRELSTFGKCGKRVENYFGLFRCGKPLGKIGLSTEKSFEKERNNRRNPDLSTKKWKTYPQGWG